MRLILFIVSLLPLNLIAQDTLSHFSLGASIEGDWCDRRSTIDGDQQFLKSQYDSLETGRIRGGLGFCLQYRMNNNLSIQSGVNYIMRGYRIDTISESELTNLRYNFNYIELPVYLNLKFRNEKKIQPMLFIGASFRYLVHMQTKFYQMGINTEKVDAENDDILPFAVNACVGIGFSKNIYDRTRLQIAGLFNQSITAITESPYKRLLNSAGIQIAITRDI